MFRAVYDFETQENQALSFTKDDLFTVMDTSDQYWWLVQNGFGEVGFVPANYLEQDSVSTKQILCLLKLLFWSFTEHVYVSTSFQSVPEFAFYD